MRPYLLAGLIAVALSMLVNVFYSKQPAITKAEVETTIKSYLLEHPGVVIEALESYRDQQEELARAETRKALEGKQNALFNDPSIPSVGPADADVVVAEFFDYHCGYCKRMIPVITTLLEEDKKVRVVFHELPILSADSRLAAKAALAVFQLNPEQYFTYHTQLMNTSGKYTKENLTQKAVALGVDEEKFKAALETKQLDDALGRSKKLASALGVSGTPAFVIGSELLAGASSLERLQKVIAKQREAGS